ncbi:hypothetical protein ACW9SN_002828 [Klebsiella quasipneumoniae]
MNNNQLTKERLQEIAEDGFLKHGESKVLARIALAAMDSEPVAWTDEHELRDVDRGGCGYLFTVNPVTPHADERRIILLYRHAQPVPVVLDEVTAEDCPALVKYDVTEVDEAWARGFNACRAAMLDNCATVESRNNAGCSPKNGLKCATVLQAEPVTTANKLGNSPVIPDGYVMVPKEVTQEIGNAINVVGNRCTCGNCSQRLWDFLLAAAPQEVK